MGYGGVRGVGSDLGGEDEVEAVAVVDGEGAVGDGVGDDLLDGEAGEEEEGVSKEEGPTGGPARRKGVGIRKNEGNGCFL